MNIAKKKLLLSLLRQFKQDKPKKLTAKQAVMLSMKILSNQNGGVSFQPSPKQLRELQQGYKQMISDLKYITEQDVTQIVSEDGEYLKYKQVKGAVTVNTMIEEIYQNYFGRGVYN